MEYIKIMFDVNNYQKEQEQEVFVALKIIFMDVVIKFNVVEKINVTMDNVVMIHQSMIKHQEQEQNQKQ